MKLFDTRRSEIVELDLGPEVTIYSCGVTPYDSAHLGHVSTFIMYDLIERRLRDAGHTTRLVRNITDIDEPLFDKANELGVDFMALADTEIEQFRVHMTTLGMLAPWAEPRASEVLDEIRDMISRLVDRGFAYSAGGSVYFEVSAWPTYGELSRHDEATMRELAAQNGGVGPSDPHARNELDFVLWRRSDEVEPSWPSPWGAGRPGWHIECSAMVHQAFGATVDIHGGGTDLIFPHHECEIAQSAAYNDEPLARYWVHAPMVRLGDTKMSKSLGNMVFVRDLTPSWTPAEIRLAVLAQHYRGAWDWRNEFLDEARARLTTWSAGDQSTPQALNEVRDALDADLDTPAAVRALDEAASRGESVVDAVALLGIGIGPAQKDDLAHHDFLDPQ